MITWTIREFSSLTPNELYAILQLRSEVFVVEQNCVFLDMDNKDQGSMHLMGWENDKLVAYSRIVPPDLIYKQPSIGRVVTSPGNRRSGMGRILMNESITRTVALYGDRDIKIGAQFYLKGFYESLGFIQTSDIYLEDGIQHIEMILKSVNS
jgi:ElaA protein